MADYFLLTTQSHLHCHYLDVVALLKQWKHALPFQAEEDPREEEAAQGKDRNGDRRPLG